MLTKTQATFLRTLHRNFQTSAVRSGYPQYNFKEVMMHKSEHAGKSVKMWMNICLFGSLPAFILLTYHTIKKEKEHFSHPRPPFINYNHLYGYRPRKYPWGDGKHSLFHNPVYNALPDEGYEVPDPNEGKGHGHH